MLALQDLSLAQTVQVASQTYQVPVRRILRVLDAVSTRETGVGPMGIPQPWLPVLAKAGFPLWKVSLMPQWNVAAGTWILAQEGAGARPAAPLAQGIRGRTVQGSPGVSCLAQDINAAAQTYHLPAALITAVMLRESAGNPQAISSAGAMGLMQLMPATAARYGVRNPWSPRQSIMGGAAYLAQLVREFNGNPMLVLAGYNAGARAVREAGNRIPPYPQTQQYVPDVLSIYRHLVY